MDERLKKIADYYGLDSQLDMLQEECAELVVAVNKFKRCRTAASLDSCVPIVTEEMADVFIMLDQITYLLNKELASEEVKFCINLWIEQKIRRQIDRMEGEEE